MNYYYLNEVPIFTYAMVGITTTVVLAAASMQDYNSNNQTENIKEEPTILSSLSPMKTLTSLTSPLSSSSLTTTPKQGGKKNKTKKNKK
jgi:hypothetical protein